MLVLAWGWGDPHITNLDSFSFTFNGLGEYRMVEIDSETFFHMQGRTARVNANISATEFVALAFYVPLNETIEIQVLLPINVKKPHLTIFSNFAHYRMLTTVL